MVVYGLFLCVMFFMCRVGCIVCGVVIVLYIGMIVVKWVGMFRVMF